MRGQRDAPAAPYPRERPGTHFTGGWVGRSGQLRKISPPPGFDPQTVQPVGSCYTDYATRPTKNYIVNLKICGRRLHKEQADSFLLDPRLSKIKKCCRILVRYFVPNGTALTLVLTF